MNNHGALVRGQKVSTRIGFSQTSLHGAREHIYFWTISQTHKL